MDIQSPTKSLNPTVRQLANLKVLSRLLGHELHAQGTSKTIQLSRDEVVEMQTTIDLFIEDVSRRHGGAAATQPAAEPQLVPARN
jgi:hypothetical protein